tara:strand:+ start:106 stop:618 length:513 start_codon:yes stop_codon:yes gene_type:complete
MTTFNIATTTSKFTASLGNGRIMGSLFKDAIDHIVKTRDTTVIVKMINSANKKNDSVAIRSIKNTFSAIFIGAKFVTDNKTKNLSIKIKGTKTSNSAIDNLNSLVADNASMRGDNWGKAFNSIDSKPKNAIDGAKNMLAFANKHNVSLSDMYKQAIKLEKQQQAKLKLVA